MSNLADKLGFGPKRVETRIASGWLIEVTPGLLAGKGLPAQRLVLTEDQYRRYLTWRDGPVMIQNALPDLSKAEREVLMSGLGDEDFHRIAGDEED